jgi:hypothetical protein
MSITCQKIISNNLTSTTNTVGSAIIPTTAGTSGQYLQSQGNGSASNWTTINPATIFNQTLNTTNNAVFGDITVGGTLFPTIAGNSNQYLQSTGSSANWTIPKTNAVSATSTSSFTFTSSSFTPITGLSLTITPTSTTSTIMLLANIGCVYVGSNSIVHYAVSFFRGSTNVGNGVNGISFFENFSVPLATPISFSYLDSPSTTSPITYTVQINKTSGSATTTVNQGQNLMTFIAYEI